MKKLTIGLSATALAVAGGSIALAEPGKRHNPDADGDGVISRAEMQAQAATMFTKMDQNKDGKIDETDREAHRAARREKMFDALDADGNGQISKAEFNAKHERGEGKHHKGRRGHRGGKMMKMTDINNDGAVSQEELTAATMKRFDRFDANSDGQITKEEREKVRAEMRQKWQEMKKSKASED